MIKDNPYKDIEKRVSVYIEGKHGRIGFIVPDQKPTEEECIKLSQHIAEIIFRANPTITSNYDAEEKKNG